MKIFFKKRKKEKKMMGTQVFKLKAKESSFGS